MNSNIFLYKEKKKFHPSFRPPSIYCDDDVTEVITLDPDSDSDEASSDRPRKSQKTAHKSDTNDIQPIASTSKAGQSNDKDNKYEDAFTAFILEDLHAVSVLNDSGFKKLIRLLKPDCRLPTYDAVLNRVELLYGLEKADLLDKLHDVEHISISTERWKSETDAYYMTIKATFIDADWVPQSYILTTSPCGGGQQNKIQINEAIRNWDIVGKIVSVVYDVHDVNWIVTMENDEFHSSAKVNCFAKTLQWCIDYGLNSIKEIRELVAHCKRIVTFFQHSVSADIYLLKYQKSLEIPPNQLIQSTAEDINSTYLMMDRLLSQRLAIEAVLTDQDIISDEVKNGLRLTEAEWTTITKLVDTLRPFQLAKEILFLDRTAEAVMSIVKPVIFSICENFLTFNLAEDSAPIYALKKSIKETLQRHFNLYIGKAEIAVPDFLDIATFLDPRYKRQEYLGTDKNREIVRQHIRSKCFPATEQPSTSTPSLLNRSLKAINLLFPSKSPDSSTNVGTDEWSRYVAEPEIKKNLPLHKWWKLNETVYPNIARMAKIYLCTLATAKSVWSQRYMCRRTLLPPQDIDKFIFLNHKLD